MDNTAVKRVREFQKPSYSGSPSQTNAVFAVGRGGAAERVRRGVNDAARDAQLVPTRRRFGYFARGGKVTKTPLRNYVSKDFLSR